MKKKVYVAANPTDASLVRGVLESRGIEVEVRGEALWSARGLIPMTPDTAPSVWVEERDAEKASRILETEWRAAESAPAWTCARCQETVDAPLDECWSCGRARS